MKRPVLLALMSVFVLHPAGAWAQVINKAAAQTAIIASEKAINDAFVKGDMKTFHSYITPDSLSLDGMGVTKAADFDKMMADYKVLSYAITADQFVWLDDVNVIHLYRWTGKATYKGQPAPSDTWSSTVWTNNGGKWLGVFHQEAVVMPPEPTSLAAPKALPAKK